MYIMVLHLCTLTCIFHIWEYIDSEKQSVNLPLIFFNI